MLVVDASVIAPAIADGGQDGDTCRARIKGQLLAVPDLLRLEEMSMLRRQLANGSLSSKQATNALDDLLNLPLVVYPTALLLRRGWELRANVTAYDSCYAHPGVIWQNHPVVARSDQKLGGGLDTNAVQLEHRRGGDGDELTKNSIEFGSLGVKGLHDDVFGCELFDGGGDTVVAPPTGTRGDDEHAPALRVA